MTSTPFNIGLGDNARLSSRVLRPPGGGHTDIFGGDPEPPRGRRRGADCGQDQITPITNGSEANGQVKEQAEAAAATAPAVEPAAPASEPPAAPPATKTDAPPQQPAAEPPKRVRVPPGGFSSGLW